MSQDYDNNMRGVLFKNDRKETDRHPDYKGSCEVDGAEMWIAAWIKEGRNGKFMSLSFTPKDDAAEAPPPPTRALTPGVGRPRTNTAPPRQSADPRGSFDDMDSDIPF